ncbi:MAG: hypothetical protein ACPGVA_07450 [Pikeienuella sp.]
MIRSFGICGALALVTACAPTAQAPAPQAAAPVVDRNAIEVRLLDDGVIRVGGAIENKAALDPIHCAAAYKARELNAGYLEWVGGVSSHIVGETERADLVYQTFEIAKPRKAAKTPDDGVLALATFLAYCAEAA